MVPLQYASGPGSDGVEAIGILTEGEAIIIRSPLETKSVLSPAEEMGGEALPSPAAKFQSPHKAEENPSTFAVVLDSIEQAIETAAVAVETMAGGVSSPHELDSRPEAHPE